MARHADPTAALVYPVFHEWLTGSLVDGRSLLTPDRAPWTEDNLEQLVGQFIAAPDYTEKMVFLDKLHNQIEDVTDDAVLLMAELHVVHFLMIWKGAIGAAKKVSDVETILRWRESTAGVEVPTDIVDAFQTGVAHPGQWALTYRHNQLGYLIRFAQAALATDDWPEPARDPQLLKAFVDSIETDHSDTAQRLSVVHLALPDHFEPIVQPKHKDAIVARYGELLDAVPEDVDEAILQIREKLTPELGERFDWYAEPTGRIWLHDEKAWSAFCHWVERIHAVPNLDGRERDYKLALVDKLVAARAAMSADAADWPDQFKRAIRASNLVAVMTKTRMADWVDSDPDGVRAAVLPFWVSDDPVSVRFDALGDNPDEGVLTTDGERLSLGSVLLMADGAEDHPPLKVTALRRAWLLAGWGDPKGLSAAGLHEQAMAFFDELCRSVPALRDRLDAQSDVWALLNYGDAPEGFTDAEWTALLGFRGDEPAAGDEGVEPGVDEGDEQSEAQRRKARYQAIVEAWAADETAQSAYADEVELYEAASPAARATLDRCSEDLDLDRLRSWLANGGMAPSWMRRGIQPNYLRHAVNLAGPDLPGVSRTIVDAYRPPDSVDDAVRQLTALYETYRSLEGVNDGYVAVTPIAASAVWALQDRTWPFLSPSAEGVLQRLGWSESAITPVDRYRVYAETLGELDDDAFRAVRVLDWYAGGGVAGVDPAAQERCRHNQRLARAFYVNDKEYPDQDAQTAAEQNTRALIGDLRYLTSALKDKVAEALDAEVGDALPPPRYGAALPYRHDAFAGWRLAAEPSTPTVRVWVTADRIVVGIHPGWTTKGWYDEAAQRAHSNLPEGLSFYRLRTGAGVYALDPKGSELPGGEFVVGRELTPAEATSPDVGAAVIDACIRLRPVIDALRGTQVPLDDDGDVVISGEIDHLDAASTDLLIDRSDLESLVELLNDRGQIVLYGPPGTGKTYLAKRLARALAADRPERFAVVQFHPATTYEDFIEGLRPVVIDGQVSYELTPGPLVRMAADAAADPAGTYVIVIDEINRANLPKVLGELLFLLEYRDEPVRLLYRPGEPFTLPKNLFFIGTMNTADRSIALVDAAMRRRFHFVGFFPHQGMMRGLLRRWLVEHHRPERVADFVEAVNEELRRKLGDHLLLGPSFFMREDLSDPALARIWEHNVFPFLEEQFWGRPELDDWRWPAVLSRHGARLRGTAGGDVQAGDEEDELDGFVADEPLE